MAQVLLHNSTLTPAPAGYGAAVEKAMAAANATLGADGEVSLEDRLALALYLDPDDDIAVIDLERFDGPILDLIFDLAEATASFVVAGGSTCATPATGGPPRGWALGFQAFGITERADFHAWLAADIQDQLAEEARQVTLAAALAKARADRDAKPAKPLFKRLTDALFGKSI
jgi:hypothetical protein